MTTIIYNGRLLPVPAGGATFAEQQQSQSFEAQQQQSTVGAQQSSPASNKPASDNGGNKPVTDGRPPQKVAQNVEGTGRSLPVGVYKDPSSVKTITLPSGEQRKVVDRYQVLSSGKVLALRGRVALSDEQYSRLADAPGWLTNLAISRPLDTPTTLAAKTLSREEIDKAVANKRPGETQTEAVLRQHPEVKAEQDVQKAIAEAKVKEYTDKQGNINITKALDEGVPKQTLMQAGVSSRSIREAEHLKRVQEDYERKLKRLTEQRNREKAEAAKRIEEIIDEEGLGSLAGAIQSGKVSRSLANRAGFTDEEIDAAIKRSNERLERATDVREQAARTMTISKLRGYQAGDRFDLVGALLDGKVTETDLRAAFRASDVEQATKTVKALETLKDKGIDVSRPVDLADALAQGIKPSTLEAAGFKDSDIREALQHRFARKQLGEHRGLDERTTLVQAIEAGISNADLRKAGYTQQAIDAAKRQAVALSYVESKPKSSKGTPSLNRGVVPILLGTAAAASQLDSPLPGPGDVVAAGLLVAAGIVTAAQLAKSMRKEQGPADSNILQDPPTKQEPTTTTFPKSQLERDVAGFPLAPPKVGKQEGIPTRSGVDERNIQQASKLVDVKVDDERVQEVLKRVNEEIEKKDAKGRRVDERTMQEALDILLGRGSKSIRDQYDRMNDAQRLALLRQLVEEARRYIVATIPPGTPNRNARIAQLLAATTSALTAALQSNSKGETREAAERAVLPRTVTTTTADIPQVQAQPKVQVQAGKAASTSTSETAETAQASRAKTSERSSTKTTTATKLSTATASKTGAARQTQTTTQTQTQDTDRDRGREKDRTLEATKATSGRLPGPPPPPFKLPTGEVLPPGRYPKVVTFLMGPFRHTVDFDKGTREVRPSRTSGEPDKTLRVLEFMPKPPKPRRFGQGAFAYRVDEDSIDFTRRRPANRVLRGRNPFRSRLRPRR